MRKIRLIVSYDGTAYFGSQMQPETVTVEQKLTKAVQGLTRASVQLILTSHMDTGVHALGNITVLDTGFPMSAECLATVLNAHLPSDIRIQVTDEVALSWYPQKQHCEKTYEYRIWNGRIMNSLLQNSAAHCYVPLSLAAMHTMLLSLLGEYDFVAFCTSDSAASRVVRRIFHAELMAECEEGGSFMGLVTSRITESGSLYHMVRILAGTLLEIGSGKKGAAALRKALRGRARHDTGPVAPTAGFVLRETRYPPVPSRYIVDNGDWRYKLSQENLVSAEISRPTIEHRRPDDYAGLMTRLLHKNHRDKARYVPLRDSEDSIHFVIGQRYGLYEMREDMNPENRSSFLYLITEAESDAA